MDYQVLIDGLKEIQGKLGWLGLAVGVLLIAIDIYKTDPAPQPPSGTLQRLLWMATRLVKPLIPTRFRWEALGVWQQRGVVFAGSLVGLALAAVMGGLGWSAALLSALPVAAGAALTHTATKAATTKVASSTLSGVTVSFKPPEAKP